MSLESPELSRGGAGGDNGGVVAADDRPSIFSLPKILYLSSNDY